MNKGQYQLVLGLLVITVIGVSIGIASYYTILKPTVKTNQTTTTTTREIVEEPSCCCELPCDSLESPEIMNCNLLAIDTCPAERPFTCTIVMCTAEKTTQPTTTTTKTTTTTIPECKCSWFTCNQNCGSKSGNYCLFDSNCFATTTSITTSSTTSSTIIPTTTSSFTTATQSATSTSSAAPPSTTTSTTTSTTSTTTTTATATFAPPVNRDGLVGEWNFDEGFGSSSADTSGNGNTGTVYGATWTEGMFEKALSFDGTSDYVDVGNSSSLNPLGSSTFSLEAWFYEKGGSNYIVSKGSPASSAASNVGFSFSRAKFYLGTSGSSNYAFLLIPGASTNAWHHVVVIRNASSNKLLVYVDGVLSNQTDYSGSYDLSNSNAKLTIGVSSKPFFSPTFSGFFNGTIDKVRVWNRGLSATEVYQLYTGSWFTTKSLVDTVITDNGWAIDYPKQRKVFYISGIYWIFYANNTFDYTSAYDNFVYKTSSDLIHWSDYHLIKSNTMSGNRFGLWFDGTYIHYAHNNVANGEPVMYRRGTPHVDGTITWEPERVAYNTPANSDVKYTAVIVDGDGYPWVYTMQFDNGNQQQPYTAMVIRNDKKDGSGTWTVSNLTHAVNFYINATNYTLPMPVGCPLTGSKTYWVYLNSTQPATYVGKLWDGTSWIEEKIPVDAKADSLYNVVCDGDDVHLSYANIKYAKRTWGLGWGNNFTVTSDAGSSGHQVITKTGTNSVVVIWENKVTDHLWYREMIDGVWQPKVDWIDESAEHFAAYLGTASGNRTQGVNINGLVDSGGFAKIVNVYTTGSPPEYKLKVAAVTLP